RCWLPAYPPEPGAILAHTSPGNGDSALAESGVACGGRRARGVDCVGGNCGLQPDVLTLGLGRRPHVAVVIVVVIVIAVAHRLWPRGVYARVRLLPLPPQRRGQFALGD